MKKLITTLFVSALLILSFNACTNDESAAVDEQNQISEEVLFQIKKLGFSTENVIKEEGGYIVEGDIFLKEEDLEHEALHGLAVRVAEEEQYHTFNLVTGLPRVITVRVTGLPARYTSTTQAALDRYNALNVGLSFQLVTSGGNIVISAAPSNASYLASAGFPTSSGNPHNSILVNSTYLETNAWNDDSVTSILAHEIGHCIGFRHTDYMRRSYSCGAGGGKEQAGSIGAVHIPGTPTGPDPNSWMLACIGKNVNRPFNANDIVALNYLY
ncbi:MAG: M57 family metalloprotease [Bacteroidia bacterium]